MPKVSIITTTYKHQDFIKYTIESVLSQTFTDWELLIGDDSPDDKTWNIIQEYINKYPDKIKAWHHKPNKGIVDNMNFLLERVSKDSEYIAFLEGDDMFTHDNLEEKIKIFEKYNEVCCVICNYYEINSKGNIIRNNIFYKIVSLVALSKTLKTGINNLTYENILLMLSNPIKSFGAVLIKKYVLEKFLPLKNLDPNNKMFGPLDYFLWLQIFPGRRIYYTNSKLLLYRVHQNNFSGDGNIIIMGKQLDMIFDYLYKKNYDNKNILKAIIFRKVLRRAIHNTIIGNKKGGFKYLFKTFKYYKFRFLFYRFKLLLRLLIPKKIIDLILKK